MLNLSVTIEGHEAVEALRDARELVDELCERYEFLSEELDELRDHLETISERVKLDEH